MTNMHAVVVQQPGDPSVLTYTEVPRPTVKPGWSLVQVKGFGINHSEVFTRQGLSPSVQFPRILGIEAVGVIVETTDSNRLPVDQTVMSFMGEMGRDYDGSYAEYVLLPNEQLHPVTTVLSWAELAAIPETGYTAFGALTGLRLQANDQLLIRGGTSGVGVMATKLAHALEPSVRVTSTTRRAEKTAQLKAIGADDVISGELSKTARFDKILDLIGPKTAKDSLQHLNIGGIVSSTGQLGGQWTFDDFEPIMDIPNNRYLTSFYSGDVDTDLLQDLLALIEAKHVDVKPARVFKLDEVAQAHELLESHHSFGKLVVVI
ncbi:NADPH:quinone reductase related Zn-dependent oxidoreductase [Lactobacillus brevis ATCC 367] [Lactiplantibacillus mudanjiangensis]|uniref:NADPH:quinone reductase related Zn-dependent oxidoreductase [Lactobacillus brevis ATCC 367] n=2 Tax=Lactiplantibacillus mudanjiangensis TaxID=1296538 RepID=A0A660E296_9LACO|nr:NADPH:quinone reductase related Zn-dependent oxidoreductase [Lactobacillus brevis ATCC 367] [Lactiplantibacillus mudanjiangensis]VDG28730.1 NADPH:quinone reductase related Zn-dependent oxidoreductase [Lactobacillus brevis ATCC 367] [Lactiplantibacillus mudanjiangensis]VDG31005.1 NADPH:quinone reductase related Zn-dependent oxidoreductase [Lactobacillus brevis ATCC 367] [Lactiplantibacillus mudanjiangensis]